MPKTLTRKQKVKLPAFKTIKLNPDNVATLDEYWKLVKKEIQRQEQADDTDHTDAWKAKLAEAAEEAAPKRKIGKTFGEARYAEKIDPNDPEYIVYLEKVAEVVATNAHEGQYRNDRKTPYINHLRAIVKKIKNPHVRIVAWLHDVVEDTDLTIKDLEKYFPRWVTDAVEAITRRDRKVETYKDYILRVKNNAIARQVKIEDINHNSQDLDKTGDKYAKYQIALHLLQN